MATKTSDTAKGFEDCIANNIPSRAFRYTAENKNILTAGAIYVGTGKTRTTKMKLDDNSNTPVVEFMSNITAVLPAPPGEGYSLQSKEVTVGRVNEKGGIVDGVTGFFPCWVKGTSVIPPEIVK